MRWTWKANPQSGAERLSTWFAYVPVRIGAETRWLERVTVRQAQRPYLAYPDGKLWENIEFVSL